MPDQRDPHMVPVREGKTGDRLLTEAAQLFSEKGYRATTTRELSALLGLQGASMYYHVKRKEDLLYQLCIDTLEDTAGVLKDAVQSSSSTEQELVTVISSYTALVL